MINNNKVFSKIFLNSIRKQVRNFEIQDSIEYSIGINKKGDIPEVCQHCFCNIHLKQFPKILGDFSRKDGGFEGFK